MATIVASWVGRQIGIQVYDGTNQGEIDATL